MKKQKFSIGIIGGTGGIGKWFARFFEGEGYAVHVSGRRSGLSLQEMADACAVVIVAVPIRDTVSMIEKVGPLIKKENLLMDFTSLKAAPVEAMLRASGSEVIGTHPLFGPDAPSLAGQNVILCPARGGRWLDWLTGILRKHDAAVTIADPQKHDEMVSLVQALNHLNTMTFGLALRESGINPQELENYSTPIFRTKKAVIDRICSNDPRLYAEIIAFNPYKNRILELYSRSLSDLKGLIDRNDTEGLAKLLLNET
jgi:prephenate dehydrogenase